MGLCLARRGDGYIRLDLGHYLDIGRQTHSNAAPPPPPPSPAVAIFNMIIVVVVVAGVPLLLEVFGRFAVENQCLAGDRESVALGVLRLYAS